MTSEKDLRKIAAGFIRDRLDSLGSDIEDGDLDYPSEIAALDELDRAAVVDLIVTWLIPDLPPADRDGYWWPEHGRNYGNVHASDGHVWVARGGPGEASPVLEPVSHPE